MMSNRSLVPIPAIDLWMSLASRPVRFGVVSYPFSETASRRLTGSGGILLSSLERMEVHLLQVAVDGLLDLASEGVLLRLEVGLLEGVEVQRGAGEEDGGAFDI